MSKALTVLAACIDIRNGKRLAKGDLFDPAPNPEQARRLITAACLPPEALDAAVAAETASEKAADEAAKQHRAEEEAAAKAKAEADKKAADEAAKKDGK
ncbi:type IV secretory pathway VirB10-like protein [Aquamicrobium lusatiense]|uniref:Type IV secretory pathway VirB10-like protein n=1 Tax=Aquamicrobium lusatiense TaxID=89772 RepID=A0A7W9VVB7_9HYPH|nr:hypothetical protein [Aquamicrobium lusatiense]MBB6011882.1 type IV secretory pathway VirB10-like protein [Aquamicrobium lusatiense]